MRELHHFDPQPAPEERPGRFASPFAQAQPGPLALRAAEALVSRLRGGRLPGGLELEAALADGQGKMFGVLVVAGPDGRLGYLCAYSGMLGGRWHQEGFVPPLFDEAARDATWPAGEAELRALDARLQTLREGPVALALRADEAERHARLERASGSLRAQHERSRAQRHEARRELERLPEPERGPRLHQLAQESRGDYAARRRFEASRRAELDVAAGPLEALALEEAALERERSARSRELLLELWDTYSIANARGERRGLRELFAPAAPPGGAGDCAGPKLIGHAYRLGLVPLELAELWWGGSGGAGGRHAGVFYPACRGNCGVILPFMLEGLPLEPGPLFGDDAIAADEPRVVFEDEWLVVVDKPVGLLSVPGRHDRLRDSVLTRLRLRYPAAGGALLVHRLDLDTSGLLLAAKDARTHAALQQQFERRSVEKRYVAWLEGEVVGEAGSISLALRGDLDDRPRQLHDPLRGRAALTDWQVLERRGSRTRVAMFPRTGRTHQLRVHAAHPGGLAAPIVGDRLYGRAGGRLLLHAEVLAFVHPHTGQTLRIERPASF